MIGVRAIDHVISGPLIRLAVHGRDGRGEALSGREPAVGFEGEGNHAWHPGGFGRARHADGLVDIGQRESRDEVGACVSEDADLPGMIGFGLPWAHQRAGIVAVAARADVAADHERRLRRLAGVANVVHHGDGSAVCEQAGCGRSRASGPNRDWRARSGFPG